MTIKFKFWFGVIQMRDRFTLVALVFALAPEFYEEATNVSGFRLEASSFQDRKAKKKKKKGRPMNGILLTLCSE